MKTVKLGDKYTDTISGFIGVATARSEFLHGCTRVMLEAETLSEGQPVEVWFDEVRLVADNGVAVEGSSKPGGPQSSPPKRDPVR